jgi:hypothetical protein
LYGNILNCNGLYGNILSMVLSEFLTAEGDVTIKMHFIARRKLYLLAEDYLKTLCPQAY